MAQLGFVGLGTMGAPIVRRLLDAGHQVAGYNRTAARAQPLVEAGMRLLSSPCQVAQASEITFSMVSDTAALAAVTNGPDGILAGLSPANVYVEMSTVSPRLTRDLDGRVAGLGGRLLATPVSGSVPAARSGSLIVFAGGDAAALDRVRPILEVLSQKIIHVGSPEQAVTQKIAINLALIVQLLPLFEGVLLAERSGLSREAALDALLNSVAASPAMKYRAPFILTWPDEVWFNTAMAHKDIQLALELGREHKLPLFSAALANEMLATAVAMGYGEEDFAALFRVVARLGGAPAA
jgi:3-hydroxyisobutyrate dehydrogenase-like beta-hydroxyacid dehydrogenase